MKETKERRRKEKEKEIKDSLVYCEVMAQAPVHAEKGKEKKKQKKLVIPKLLAH